MIGIGRFLSQAAHEDPNALLALSDWLQHQNDPWGELIAIQHALSSASSGSNGSGALNGITLRRPLELRAEKLKQQHLGSLARFVSPWGAPSESRPLELQWRMGVVERAIVHPCPSDAMSTILSALFALPAARLTRSLTLDLGQLEGSPLHASPDDLTSFSANLNELVIWSPRDAEFSWSAVPLQELTQLERLHLGAGSLAQAQARALSSRLIRLVMVAREDTCESLDVRWDRLVSLVLWGFDCPPRAYPTLIDALSPERFPALKSLRLCGFERADLFARTWLQGDQRLSVTLEQCGFNELPEDTSSLRFCGRSLWRQGPLRGRFRRALVAFQDVEQDPLDASAPELAQLGFELSRLLAPRRRPNAAMTGAVERLLSAQRDDLPDLSLLFSCAIRAAEPPVRASMLLLLAEQRFGLQKELLLLEVEALAPPKSEGEAPIPKLYFQARVERARQALAEGRGADALQLAQSIADPSPRTALQRREANWVLGQCHRRRAEYALAEKALRTSLLNAEDPAHRIILEASLAVLELDQGRFAAARPVLEETLSRCTFEGAQTAAASIRAQLARCLRKLDQPLRALQTIEAADPQTIADPDLQTGLVAEQGLALHALGNKAEGGEKLLQSAIVLEKLGRAAQAIERFLQLAELRVNDGDHDAARTMFERAQALYLEDQMPKEKARFDQLRALMKRPTEY